MKLLFSISFLLCLNAVVAQGTLVDGIAAQVGDNIILFSDIESQKIQFQQQSGQKLTEDTECQLLEELMYQELLINQAKLDSILISDEQVDAEMENRLRQIEAQMGSRQKFEEFYGKTYAQIKNEFRTIIRDRMMAQEMERQITANITITPKEVKEFYNELPSDSIPYISAQLTFEQIVWYPEVTQADKLKAYNKLKDIREQIINGKSFSLMARLHSMDPGSASNGGNLGEVHKGMMVAPFESAAYSLKEGEISDVFETDYGYHIIKLIKRRGEMYEAAHILISPEYEDEALESAAYKIDSCYYALKAGSMTWEQAVLKYSNDETTKQNNGLIINPYTGDPDWEMEHLSQIDQQIYLLTDNLKEGEYSEPSLYYNIIERKQGVRIVRLVKRVAPHKANLEQDYALIKAAAENKKKEELIDAWIEAKIKNAYIRVSESYAGCTFTHQWIAQ